MTASARISSRSRHQTRNTSSAWRVAPSLDRVFGVAAHRHPFQIRVRVTGQVLRIPPGELDLRAHVAAPLLAAPGAKMAACGDAFLAAHPLGFSLTSFPPGVFTQK